MQYGEERGKALCLENDDYQKRMEGSGISVDSRCNQLDERIDQIGESTDHLDDRTDELDGNTDQPAGSNGRSVLESA